MSLKNVSITVCSWLSSLGGWPLALVHPLTTSELSLDPVIIPWFCLPRPHGPVSPWLRQHLCRGHLGSLHTPIADKPSSHCSSHA